MKLWRLLFVIVLMIFNLSINSSAAEKPKKKTDQSGKLSSAATKAGQPTSATVSVEGIENSGAVIDLNVSRLPQHYAGNDFVKIYTACKDNADRFVKTQFENDQQFEKRKAGLLVSPLLGKLKYGDNLALSKKFMSGDFNIWSIIFGFTAQNAVEKLFLEQMKAGLEESRTALSYDAEKGTARITLGSPILFERVKKSSYQATNAYGATVTVQRAEGTIYLLKCLPQDCTEFSLIAEMSGETAQRLSQNGRVLLIGKVKEPFVKVAMPISITPTFKEPREITIAVETLLFDVSEIWLYDFETGEIFAKH